MFLDGSVGFGVAAEDGEGGAGDYAQVEEEGAVAYIPDVEVEALLHSLGGVGKTPAAVYLCPAGDAGLHGVTRHVAREHAAVLLGLAEHVGPRAHHRHFAAQHIEKLGKLVE